MLDKDRVQMFMTRYLSAVACAVQYKWTDKFSMEEIRRATNQLMSELKGEIDFSQLTVTEAEYLGCIPWDDKIHLLPIYLLPIIPIGTKLISVIERKEITYDGNNIDNDTRAGMLAYGIEFIDDRIEFI